MATKLPSVTSPPWSATTKRLVVLILLGLALLIVRRIGGAAWTSIAIAVVLAYLLSPVVTFFENRFTGISSEVRRTVAVLMTWLLVLGILALVVGLIVPATVSQLRDLAERLPTLAEETEADLSGLLSRPIHIGDFTIVPWDEIQAMVNPPNGAEGQGGVTDTIQNALLSVADSALSVVGGAVSFIFSLFIVLVMLFYLMRDGPVFAAYLVAAVPESYRGDVLRLMYELGVIWNAYLRGQLLLNVAVGVATYIVALILGLPQPLILALLAGFLELIPNLGPTLSAIPAVLFALVTPSSTIPGLDAGIGFALVVSLAYILIQQLESIFLVPRILGSSLDLHPFVVIVAIVIGASIAGLLGVILAAPSVATLRLFGRYLRGKLLDEEVFPVTPTLSTQQRGFIYRLIHYFLSKRFPVLPPGGMDELRRAQAELAAAEVIND